MIITDLQKKVLFETYDRCTLQLLCELEAHKARIVNVMNRQDLKRELEWDVFAREVFLDEIKTFHEHHHDQHSAVKAAQRIIDKG